MGDVEGLIRPVVIALVIIEAFFMLGVGLVGGLWLAPLQKINEHTCYVSHSETFYTKDEIVRKLTICTSPKLDLCKELPVENENEYETGKKIICYYDESDVLETMSLEKPQLGGTIAVIVILCVLAFVPPGFVCYVRNL